MDAESAKSAVAQLGEQALRDLYANLTGMKAFVLDQAPDVCREIIVYAITRGVVAGCILLALGAVVAVVSWRTWKIELDGADVGKIVAIVGGFALTVAALTTLNEIGMDAIKACVAPKLYLIEYVKAMLK